MRNGEFNHPSLVAVYDVECLWSRDDDFFLDTVGETPAARVLDFGCGTGRLTLGLAGAGHAVTGIDPAGASIAAARQKPGADNVTWIVGLSNDASTLDFDAVVMTSHVAQFLVADSEWAEVLADLRRALVPGGRLIFDSRDPKDRKWEQWNRKDSSHQIVLPDGTEVDIWTEVTQVQGRIVDFDHHYRFSDGRDLLSSSTLRFRTEEELRRSLPDQGFAVDHIYGGWKREPVGAGDGEFLVIARAV
ncbi:class I SAM-dependent methyltransferase [Arthrobacter monumenti]